jgi:Mrp family chromosome partitioning ATPase
MNPFISREARAVERTIVTPIRDVDSHELAGVETLRQLQVRVLVERLFFGPESSAVRHAGFTAVGPSKATAQLCLEAARVLTEDGQYDVGLIDAGPGTASLQNELEIAPSLHALSLQIGPRLWLVPRHAWLPSSETSQLTEHSISRLREVATEYDFSILCCAPVSWTTARIARACDGIVLMLTAGKTRRLVASQMTRLLREAGVPLLGTVLAERRFPVPQALYRRL